MKKHDIPKPETKLMTSIFHPNYSWTHYQPPFEDSDLYESVEGVTLKEAISLVLSLVGKSGGPSQRQRARQVIEMRFGLEDGRSRTLKEVGQEFAVTPERIRQIENKTLRSLRHPSCSRLLKPYIKLSTPKEKE